MQAMSLTVRRMGDAALLVETSDLRTAHRLHAAIRSDATISGVIDMVPGECTVLVTVDPARCDPDRLAERIARLDLLEHETVEATVEVPVVYDGSDLAEVADLTGLTEREVVTFHEESVYVVAYLGFAPGFAYLTGLDPVLHVPRRADPRTSVPAGSVAIAGPYSAVYPSASPGGWRLIGRTELALWDTRRNPPALLSPGTRVTFRAVTS